MKGKIRFFKARYSSGVLLNVSGIYKGSYEAQFSCLPAGLTLAFEKNKKTKKKKKKRKEHNESKNNRLI